MVWGSNLRLKELFKDEGPQGSGLRISGVGFSTHRATKDVFH
jgi:hypothetical protein